MPCTAFSFFAFYGMMETAKGNIANFSCLSALVHWVIFPEDFHAKTLFSPTKNLDCGTGRGLLFCLIIVLAIRGGVFSKTYTATGYVMGSYMQQTIYSRDGDCCRRTNPGCRNRGAHPWRVEDSDIQKLNAAAGISAVPIHDRTRSILTAALDVASPAAHLIPPFFRSVLFMEFDGEVHAVPSADQISNFCPAFLTRI